MREAYVTLASSVAKLFGADETIADREMREILDLEIDIANVIYFCLMYATIFLMVDLTLIVEVLTFRVEVSKLQPTFTTA